MERSKNKEDIEILTSNDIDGTTINKGETLYYARIHPSIGMFELVDIKVCTITPLWFTGVKQQTFLFDNSDVNKTVFKDRKKALEKVKEAEKNSTVKISEEKEYEEY